MFRILLSYYCVGRKSEVRTKFRVDLYNAPLVNAYLDSCIL